MVNLHQRAVKCCQTVQLCKNVKRCFLHARFTYLFCNTTCYLALNPFTVWCSCKSCRHKMAADWNVLPLTVFVSHTRHTHNSFLLRFSGLFAFSKSVHHFQQSCWVDLNNVVSADHDAGWWWPDHVTFTTNMGNNSRALH